MQFIYPQGSTDIELPLDLSGKRTQLVCKLAHRRENMRVYWYLDNVFAGSTRNSRNRPEPKKREHTRYL
ncbi:MAG: hypothetical protein R2850_01185 [Bacteroidia bacterium]